MRLYHSSNIEVTKPDISYSRDYLDFGKGFYLTSLLPQAEKYGERFLRRNQPAWLMEYDFTFNPEEWEVKIFDKYDKEWLEFISNCRKGHDTYNYELVIGGIADDKVIRTLDRYMDGDISFTQALGLLQYEKPNIQYCIRSQKMMNECLRFISSRKL